MKLKEMIQANHLIAEFMGTGDRVQYYEWDALMKVTKKIFAKHEQKDPKVCEMLRYALYWNNFDHIYENVIFVIKYFKTKK